MSRFESPIGKGFSDLTSALKFCRELVITWSSSWYTFDSFWFRLCWDLEVPIGVDDEFCDVIPVFEIRFIYFSLRGWEVSYSLECKGVSLVFKED